MATQKQPNFIIGGTAAGGTSFLAAVLVQHPEIYLPKEMRPEPHYYYKSWEYEKGLDYYLERWFSTVPSHSLAVGERSSSYLFGGRDVAQRIAVDFPEMKFIFTLRNPIERTWANYRYTVLQGLEDLMFEDALRQEPERIKKQTGMWAEIQPHNYTGRGFYGDHVTQFLELFDRQQILLIKSESLASDTDRELRKIYNFLGLNNLGFISQHPPNHTSCNVVNPSLQMQLRDYFGDRFDKVIEAVRKKEDFGRFEEGHKDRQAFEQLRNNMKGRKEGVPEDARKYLRNLFSADIEVLESIVDFDIKDWK